MLLVLVAGAPVARILGVGSIRAVCRVAGERGDVRMSRGCIPEGVGLVNALAFLFCMHFWGPREFLGTGDLTSRGVKSGSKDIILSNAFRDIGYAL